MEIESRGGFRKRHSLQLCVKQLCTKLISKGCTFLSFITERLDSKKTDQIPTKNPAKADSNTFAFSPAYSQKANRLFLQLESSFNELVREVDQAGQEPMIKFKQVDFDCIKRSELRAQEKIEIERFTDKHSPAILIKKDQDVPKSSSKIKYENAKNTKNKIESEYRLFKPIKEKPHVRRVVNITEFNWTKIELSNGEPMGVKLALTFKGKRSDGLDFADSHLFYLTSQTQQVAQKFKSNNSTFFMFSHQKDLLNPIDQILSSEFKMFAFAPEYSEKADDIFSELDLSFKQLIKTHELPGLFEPKSFFETTTFVETTNLDGIEQLNVSKAVIKSMTKRVQDIKAMVQNFTKRNKSVSTNESIDFLPTDSDETNSEEVLVCDNGSESSSDESEQNATVSDITEPKSSFGFMSGFLNQPKKNPERKSKSSKKVRSKSQKKKTKKTEMIALSSDSDDSDSDLDEDSVESEGDGADSYDDIFRNIHEELTIKPEEKLKNLENSIKTEQPKTDAQWTDFCNRKLEEQRAKFNAKEHELQERLHILKLDYKHKKQNWRHKGDKNLTLKANELTVKLADQKKFHDSEIETLKNQHKSDIHNNIKTERQKFMNDRSELLNAKKLITGFEQEKEQLKSKNMKLSSLINQNRQVMENLKNEKAILDVNQESVEKYKNQCKNLTKLNKQNEKTIDALKSRAESLENKNTELQTEKSDLQYAIDNFEVKSENTRIEQLQTKLKAKNEIIKGLNDELAVQRKFEIVSIKDESEKAKNVTLTDENKSLKASLIEKTAHNDELIKEIRDYGFERETMDHEIANKQESLDALQKVVDSFMAVQSGEAVQDEEAALTYQLTQVHTYRSVINKIKSKLTIGPDVQEGDCAICVEPMSHYGEVFGV